MTAGQLGLATMVVAVGAMVQGTVGFGNALVSSPLLLLIDLRLVPGPFTIAGLSLNLLMLRSDRGHADVGGVRWSVVGLVPGTVVAGAALSVMTDRGLALTAGVLILLAVALSAAGLVVSPTPRAVVAGAALSGFMGTVAAVAGPPMALLYQRATGPQLRATLARFFIVASALTLLALVPAGRLGTSEAVAGLLLVPGTVLGWATSRRLVGAVDRLAVRPAVLALSAVSAVALLARHLL